MVPVACDEENRSRVAFCGDMKRKSEQIRVSTGRVRRVELQFEYLLSALFEYPQRCRQRYLVFDRYLYRLQSQTLYLYLDRSCLRFFFCFSFLFLFLAKLLYPSPSDWQFSSIAISAISISLPPPPLPVNCVQLCINECIWPRARTQVWEFLHEMLHALAKLNCRLSGMRGGGREWTAGWRDDRFSTWTETIRKSINFLIARYDRMLR